MDATQKRLIQQVLESDIDMQAKLDILVGAGIPLGAEYTLVLNVNAKEVGTKWLDRVGAMLLKDDDVVSFSVRNLKERELGDDEWHDNIWVIPDKPAEVLVPKGRQFATTGQLSAYRSNKPQGYTFHMTDDGFTTLCNVNMKPNWKKLAYDPTMTTMNGHQIRWCGQCGKP